ncbi:MAG: zinc-dependent peptidase, partial [Granulosicoccaceae bacterium]
PRYQLSRAMKQPFPEAWRWALKRNFPIYRRMPTDLQMQLKSRIKQFVHEKEFIGCAGFEISDEVKVTVAASACLLLLNRDTDVYAGLRYILVYPDAFLVKREAMDGAGLHSVKHTGVLGESWSNGKVILSWQDVLKGNSKFSDGSNVAIHEFAHQLDHESGSTNGAPFLGKADRYERWAVVFTEEFRRLQQSAYRGDKTLIDQYGATEPAEFFAVVSELFFEKPAQMYGEHPLLFEELKAYYRVDPRDWIG